MAQCLAWLGCLGYWDLSSLDARLSFSLVARLSFSLVARIMGTRITLVAWIEDAWGTRIPWILSHLCFGTYLSLVDGFVWSPFGLSLVPSQGSLCFLEMLGSVESLVRARSIAWTSVWSL